MADGEAFPVQFLPEHLEGGGGVHRFKIVLCHAQHATGAAGRVIEGTDHAGFAEGFFAVLGKQQVHHQLDDLAGGEVLPCGLIRLLRETADQLLKHGPHAVVVHDVLMQVHLGKPFYYYEQ